MSERWKPQEGDQYWLIAFNDAVQSEWHTDSADLSRWNMGNCFKTKKEAVDALKKVTALLLSSHEEQPVTECNQRWKLTADIFNHPDCPAWAKYAAVDKDGRGFYYENKPRKTDEHWGLFGVGSSKLIGNFDSSDWQNSMIERPAKLPDWCKVGEWVWAIAFNAYFKVDKVDGVFISGTDFSGSDYCVTIENVRQAHPRPYNEEEMQGLIGKVVSNEHGNMFLVTAFVAVDGGEVCVDGVVYNADDLFECYTINGKPCGVIEHLNEKGDWVK